MLPTAWHVKLEIKLQARLLRRAELQLQVWQGIARRRYATKIELSVVIRKSITHTGIVQHRYWSVTVLWVAKLPRRLRKNGYTLVTSGFSWRFFMYLQECWLSTRHFESRASSHRVGPNQDQVVHRSFFGYQCTNLNIIFVWWTCSPSRFLSLPFSLFFSLSLSLSLTL